MTEYPQQPPYREELLRTRAEKTGYALYSPTGDRWLLADTAAGGWSTYASLEEVEERLASDEEGKDVGEEPDDEEPGDEEKAVAGPSVHQLEARAEAAGLTLVGPHEHWLVLDQPGVTYAACPSLHIAERYIEGYEHDGPDEADLPPYLR